MAVHLLAPRARVELTALQEGTAAEVEQALRTLDSDHLGTGYRPGFGYTDGYEAVSRLIEPIIEQYEADVRRRPALGMPDAAEAVALGVLDGLDACEGDYDGDEVLCYAVEGLAETYGYKIRELMRTAGRAVEWTRPAPHVSHRTAEGRPRRLPAHRPGTPLRPRERDRHRPPIKDQDSESMIRRP